MVVGKSVKRIDAFDKVTGRTKYTDDLCDKSAYIAKVLHSTIAHGKVLSVDITEALKIDGVVKIVTCFDVPKNYFPTAGHPWSTDESHQDVADRLLLTDTVRFYGDDIAAVVAENEVSAQKALRAIKVEYEEYPFVLDVQEAMKDDAPQIHKNFKNNSNWRSPHCLSCFNDSLWNRNKICFNHSVPHIISNIAGANFFLSLSIS